jgi:hypothetical protein
MHLRWRMCIIGQYFEYLWNNYIHIKYICVFNNYLPKVNIGAVKVFTNIHSEPEEDNKFSIIIQVLYRCINWKWTKPCTNLLATSKKRKGKCARGEYSEVIKNLNQSAHRKLHIHLCNYTTLVISICNQYISKIVW